jgi:hypothetical protein
LAKLVLQAKILKKIKILAASKALISRYHDDFIISSVAYKSGPE